MATLTLQDLGFTDFFAAAFEPYRSQEGLVPARVVAQMGLLRVSTGEAEYLTDLSGKLRHELKGPGGGGAILRWGIGWQCGRRRGRGGR